MLLNNQLDYMSYTVIKSLFNDQPSAGGSDVDGLSTQDLQDADSFGDQTEKSKLIEVSASHRSEFGKSATRKIIKKGLIPAVVLKPKNQTLTITMDPKWLSRIWSQGGCFVLDLDGVKHKTKIHEVQLDPIKRVPIHVDLMFLN